MGVFFGQEQCYNAVFVWRLVYGVPDSGLVLLDAISVQIIIYWKQCICMLSGNKYITFFAQFWEWSAISVSLYNLLTTVSQNVLLFHNKSLLCKGEQWLSYHWSVKCWPSEGLVWIRYLRSWGNKTSDLLLCLLFSIGYLKLSGFIFGSVPFPVCLFGIRCQILVSPVPKCLRVSSSLVT